MNEYGLVANVQQDTALRPGAKVSVISINGVKRSVFVSGVSKGGRVITKYIPIKNLSNFRCAWLSEEFRSTHFPITFSKEEAERVARSYNE